MYSQPVWQTLQMFVGELCCLLPVLLRVVYGHWKQHTHAGMRADAAGQGLLAAGAAAPASYGACARYGQARRAIPGWARTAGLFFVPALCDICATTMLNAALILMPVSIYQMTRGALVLWVGLFSVLFLQQRLRFYEWLSLLLVMLGVATVGLSSVLAHPSAGRPSSDDRVDAHPAWYALLGLGMVLAAQIFSALQFVYEEKVMGEHAIPPTLAVGLEGLFGTLLVLVLMPVLHVFVGATPSGRNGALDVAAGWRQLVGVPRVFWSSVLCALSIAFYNMFGLSVTRSVSATARSTIDTLRTLGIAVVSLLLGWETLQPLSGCLEALGFASLVYGTFVFHGVARPPRWTVRERTV